MENKFHRYISRRVEVRAKVKPFTLVFPAGSLRSPDARVVFASVSNTSTTCQHTTHRF